MYSPPILFSTQDDINDRRKVRNKYRVSARQDLLESIVAAKAQKDHSDVLSMDKRTKEAKAAAKAAREKRTKNKKKKNKKTEAQDENNTSGGSGQVEAIQSLVLDKALSRHAMQRYVDLAATAGPTRLVRLMRANPTHHMLLSCCIGAVSDMASFSQRDQLGVDKGIFASRNHSAYDAPTFHVLKQIGDADGIKALVEAMMKHRAKEGLVLRALWSLEHVLLLDENWLKFNRQGGQTRLEAVREVHMNNTSPAGLKIRKLAKGLQKQPKSGDTVSVGSKLCVLL